MATKFRVRLHPVLFQYRKRYGLHAMRLCYQSGWISAVSIPQAVWIACNKPNVWHSVFAGKFQYRKRYGLHAIQNIVQILGYENVSIPQAVWIACNRQMEATWLALMSFNTASGMDCMQFADYSMSGTHYFRFNTASGMDCMQWWRRHRRAHPVAVSIPQAVWIACNIQTQRR